MVYYAHSKDNCPEEQWQTIRTHSENVGRLCADFSKSWCDARYANNLGLLHDIGKYQASFQQRIRNKNLRVEHATCGALETAKFNMPFADYCIAGHHTGLPDIGTRADTADESTLSAKKKRKFEDYSKYQSELYLEPVQTAPWTIPFTPEKRTMSKELAFWTRMMFSSLVDADFLDTEQFCNGVQDRTLCEDFVKLDMLLEEKLLSFNTEGDVCRARHKLLSQAMAHSESTRADLFFMKMPTGSGKTLASMSFALKQAIRHRLDRIIYIIPYTSIIEQNAAVFRQIFGKGAVLEHHCNFDFETLGDETTKQKLAKATENWDAPIIVTTNVQFFESIYGNKPSQLRKLHNIANSMLVFDEVHMFPSLFYQPCLEAVKMLVTKFSCKGLFMSATMPDFEKWLKAFKCDGIRTENIISDTSLFSVFQRCKIEDVSFLSIEEIVRIIDRKESVLIIVNTKRAARAVYEKITCKKYHLSTYMTKADRSRVIGEVRKALNSNLHFVLVATSLVEAGVDFDFSCVFRERAGLDNVIQAAGRCNREGRMSAADCTTYVFDFDDDTLRTKDPHIQVKQRICRDVLAGDGAKPVEDAAEKYFDSYYKYYENEMSTYDFERYITPIGYCFEKYANAFKLIDDASIDVIIECSASENSATFEREDLKSERDKWRRLQQYAVSLRKYEFDDLFEQGVIEARDGVFYLTNPRYYNKDTGILFRDSSNYIF